MTAAHEVEDLERQRFGAQVRKEYDVLDQLFADDLIYTHSNGQQDSKSTYLQSIRDGASRYDDIEVEALHVRIYAGAQTAVVNGTITISVFHEDGMPPTITRLKYVTVQVKNAGGWQVVLWQSQKQLAV
ncbi:nuclear transport factor 2 family protein [Hymenobacter sp. BT175]|uniref:nuclear transport factor 2 family protein n=1 Tax=Hymenobacter translucens TaxID=2886507 RepID=UPI001D0E7588|nr:nuclear transport factor 2 family protein [Hymenobacter translucens]MCC2547487.1 nuclear transport factor 2 family protein [Hymenobacter translucens]